MSVSATLATGFVRGLALGLAVVVYALASVAHADRAPFVEFAHDSDPFAAGLDEVTSDALIAGVEFTFDTIKVEIGGGIRAVNCKAFVACGSSAVGHLAVRWSPKR